MAIIRAWQVPLAGLAAVSVSPASAHDVSEQARVMLANGTLLDYALAGAEHMVTGYDHVLFLLGVVFFLNRAHDILSFVTAFTLGHTITLIGGTLFGITTNPHLVDAVIALSVTYKGFENLGGFRCWLGVDAPRPALMVLLFGLVHGFGLSTKLQGFIAPSDPALVPRMLAFNLGVEVGQIAALAVMLPLVMLLRRTARWGIFARLANGLLIAAGLLLFLLQLHDYRHQFSAQEAAHEAAHDDVTVQFGGGMHRHGDGPAHSHDPEPDPTPAVGHP